MEAPSLPHPTEMPSKPFLRCSLQSIHHQDPEPDEQRLTKKWLSKAVALCKYLWPSAKHGTLSVKYLSHGSYNTVFSLSIVTAGDQPAEYVLRIPEGDSSISRTAGILEYLTEYSDLKVPKVITWDATTDNPLENGYIILSRIPGKCLQEVWEDLTHSQKLVLAQEMAKLLLQVESVTNQVAGTIKVHEKGLRHGDRISNQMFVEAFGADVLDIPDDPVDWHNLDNDLLPLDRLRHDPPNLSTSDIMSAIFKRRIYQAKNRKTNSHDYLLEFFEPCHQMVEDMVNDGVFEAESDVICLHHVDLFPRNIMVDLSSEITITGVLDWDVALFVPRFAGRAPPRWLWRSVPQEDSQYAKFDMEPLDPDDNEPDSPENAEIKKAFETAVGEAWVSESTGRPYPFARRLLRFGRQDSYDGDDIGNLLEWIDNWNSEVDNSSVGSDAESVSTEELGGSEHGETAVHDETDGDDEISQNQQDDNDLIAPEEGPVLPSTLEQEKLEYQEAPTDTEILEYDDQECSSSSGSKHQETVQLERKVPIEERQGDKALVRGAWDNFRSLLADLPEDEIQIPRDVDSSMKAIQDWLESQSKASPDQGHSDRELSMTHVRDCLEGTQKCSVVSTSATTGKKKKLRAIITKLTRKHDGNASWMGAIRDWASSFLRTSLKVRPAITEIPTTTTRQHENPKGSPKSS